VKWLCFDIDPERTKNVWTTAKEIYKESSKLFKGESLILEASRYPDPSAHIWACFYPILAQNAKEIGERVIGKTGAKEVELFPKQTDVGGRFGNMMKLPLGLHRKEKKWSLILNPESLEPLTSKALLEVRPATLSRF